MSFVSAADFLFRIVQKGGIHTEQEKFLLMKASLKGRVQIHPKSGGF